MASVETNIIYGRKFSSSTAFMGGNGDSDGSFTSPIRTPLAYFLDVDISDLKKSSEIEEQLKIETPTQMKKQLFPSFSKLKRKIPKLVIKYLNRDSYKGKTIVRNSSRSGGIKKNSGKLRAVFSRFFGRGKKSKMGFATERHGTPNSRNSQESHVKFIEEEKMETFNRLGWGELDWFAGLSIDSHESLDDCDQPSLSETLIKDEKEENTNTENGNGNGDSDKSLNNRERLPQNRMALKQRKKSTFSPFNLFNKKSFKKKSGTIDSSSSSDNRYGDSEEGWHKTVNLKARKMCVPVKKVVKMPSFNRRSELCKKRILMGHRCQPVDLNSPSMKDNCRNIMPVFGWEMTSPIVDHDVETGKWSADSAPLTIDHNVET